MELPEDLGELRAKAWIGDAVLGLYARQWILAQSGSVSSAVFENMTSNAFLTTLGNPTKIEARIGILYETGGLRAANGYIEEIILPKFLSQERNRSARDHGKRK